MLKKILATALAAAMIFGMASVAFAASFSDTAGSTNEKAVVKLASLGLLKGYDDGTFKPLGNITRAEFAAVVVRALGYESSAVLLTGAPAFSDCADAQWAWGYINVATSQGIIKGYPEGTFAPNANVTIAEAVTMLVRALGRDAQATGIWPTGHIMVASQVGMLPSSLPGVDVAATRGTVAQLVSNVLDKPFAYKDADGVWQEKATESFLLNNDATTLKAKKIASVSTTNNTVTLDGEATARNVGSAAQFVGSTGLAGFKGMTVDLLLDEDGYIIYIGTTSASSVAGVVTAIDKTNKTITIGGTAYTVPNGATCYYNGKEIVGDALAKIADLKDADATITLDTAGKVAYISATELNLEGKIESISSTVSSKKLTIDGTERSMASSYTVVKNGTSAAFADLKVNDSVEFSVDASGNINYVDAYSVKVSGVLQEKNTVDDHVSYKINDVAYIAAVDDDGDDAVDEGANVIPGNSVTLTLDRDGKVVAAALQSTPTSSTVTLQSKKDGFNADGDAVKTVTLSDGTTVTLAVGAEIYKNNFTTAAFADLSSGDQLFLTKNPAGKVTLVEAFSSVSGYVYRPAGVPTDAFAIVTTKGDPTTTVGVINPAAADIDGDAQMTSNGKLQIVSNGVSSFAQDATIKISGWTLGASTDPRTPSLILKTYDRTGFVVKAILTVGEDTYIQLHDGTAAYDGDAEKFVKLTSTTIVHKSDAKINGSDIVIGDKISMDVNAGTDGSAADANAYTALFVYVTADTAAPTYATGNAPHTHDGVAKTVYLNPKEDVRVSWKIYAASGNLVYSGASTVEIARNSEQVIVWNGTSFDSGVADADKTSSSFTMVLTVKDYAGNALDPVSVKLN